MMLTSKPKRKNFSVPLCPSQIAYGFTGIEVGLHVKAAVCLNTVHKFSFYCPLSTLLLYYEDQSDNAVQEINHMRVENAAICIISCNERALPICQSHHVA